MVLLIELSFRSFKSTVTAVEVFKSKAIFKYSFQLSFRSCFCVSTDGHKIILLKYIPSNIMVDHFAISAHPKTVLGLLVNESLVHTRFATVYSVNSPDPFMS